MGKVTHDLRCKGCGAEFEDVRAERLDDGVHVNTPEGRDVLAVCSYCGDRLDIALKGFGIIKGRRPQKDPSAHLPECFRGFTPKHLPGDPIEIPDRGDGNPGLGIVETVFAITDPKVRSVIGEAFIVKPDRNSSTVLN